MMFGGKSWSSLLLESHVHSASYFSESANTRVVVFSC